MNTGLGMGETGVAWDLWASGAATAAALGLLAVALWRRWFDGLRNGLATALLLSLVGAGVLTALVVGTWAYHEARAAVFDQLREGLDNVGRIAEGELLADVRMNVDKLANIADDRLMKNVLEKPDAAREDLGELEQYNRRLLQINVYDPEGKLLLSTSRLVSKEPPGRVAAAYASEGKTYVSDPYKSTAFGRYVLLLAVPVKGADGKPVGSMTVRYDIQDKLASLFGDSRFGATGYAVLVDHDGRVLAHRDAGRVGEDLSSYPAYKAAAGGGSGWLVDGNKAGDPRLFVYRPIASPATNEGRHLVLLTEMDAAEAAAPVWALRAHVLVGAAVMCLAWAVLAVFLARHLTRPLAGLLDLAAKVGGGDLSVQAEVTGRDEIGRFAAAFNAMVAGLRERDRVKQIFGRYVTTQVSERVLKHGLKLGGERKQITMLFADIRNFTSMSEAMQPEQVVELLNEYFSEMVGAVVEHGGVLDKFIGDGMLAVFGSMDEPDRPTDHRRQAVLTGLRMKARLAKINGEREMRGLAAIHIGIGIHTDEVVVGHIGSRDRVEHTVIGDGVNTCSRVESMNKELGTTLLITEQTREPIADAFDCKAMPETKVKGKAKPLKVYEVLSARQTTAPGPQGPQGLQPTQAPQAPVPPPAKAA
jgi:adenylate cyclase